MYRILAAWDRADPSGDVPSKNDLRRLYRILFGEFHDNGIIPDDLIP